MSKAKKTKKTNAIRMVEQHGIAYEEFSFPWSESHAEGMLVAEKLDVPSAEIFKTLMTIGTQTGPLVAVIPVDHELNLKALAQVSGNKKVDMLPLKDLENTTGYQRGGCSPIGMKKLFPTYLDQRAQEYSGIYVSAGRRGAQIKLAPTDLADLVKGQFAALTQ